MFEKIAKKVLIFIIIGLFVFTLSGCPVANVSLKCLDFEGLVLGAVYNVGDSFAESNYTVTGTMFYWSNGTPFAGGFTKVENGGKAGYFGKEMAVNNINLSFNFQTTLSRLSLHYGEYGGNINVRINGILENVADFSDIDNTSVGGVNVTLTGVVGSRGILNLEGEINSFSIGGQELWIDHVCPKK